MKADLFVRKVFSREGASGRFASLLVVDRDTGSTFGLTHQDLAAAQACEGKRVLASVNVSERKSDKTGHYETKLYAVSLEPVAP